VGIKSFIRTMCLADDFVLHGRVSLATRLFNLEDARRKNDPQDSFQSVELDFVCLESNLDSFGRLTPDLQAEEASLQLRSSYPEMPRKRP
jgi:hypothetical protein